MPIVTDFLMPRLADGAIGQLREAETCDLDAEDSEWLKMLISEVKPGVSDVVGEFADELDRRVARCYHGCRTDDAGEYFRRGIRVHNREELEERVRALVAKEKRLRWMLPNLPELMAKFPSGGDEHKCYVVFDDRFLIKHAAHYLIYGSEWISAVLGHGWRDALLERGVPTMIEIDLPIRWVSVGLRVELAKLLLGEWTRRKVNSLSDVFLEDFTFTVHHDLPPETVVGHYHPESIENQWDGWTIYRSPATFCLHCGKAG